jgi:hypothetical protein
MIFDMGERALTFKQKRFCELVGAGCSRVDAFRQAYPGGPRTKGTEWEQAKRVGRVPKVKAEIERLSLLRSPYDAAAQAEHVAARLLELSKSSDPDIALKAISQWTKLAAAAQLKPPPSARDTEKARLIIDEILSFAEAQHAAPPPLPLAPDQDDDAAVIDLQPEELAPVSVVTPSPLLPSTDQDDAAGSVQQGGPEEGAVFAWKQLPGYFGRSRLVRVRVR